MTRNILIVTLLILPFLILSGCKGSKKLPGDTLTVVPISQGVYSSVDTRAQRVVRDLGEWKAVWKRIQMGQTPQPALPSVDFGQQMVLVAFMGQQNSGGYLIDIPAVSEKDGILYAKVMHRMPGEGCVTTMAITNPYVAVAVPRSFGENVQFQVEEVTTDCN